MTTRRHLLSGLGAAVSLAAVSPVAFAAGLADGSPLPVVELMRLDGSHFQLAKLLDGKVGLLSFWATWCGPCMMELPSLDRLHAKLASEPGIEVLAVNVDQGAGTAVLSSYWKRQGFSLPLALDATGQASTLFGVRMLPMSFLISKQGKVRYSLPGARSWESDQWVRGLQAMAREDASWAG